MFSRLKDPDATAPVEEIPVALRAPSISSTGARDTTGTISDPEVLEKPRRRQFTAKYKRYVVEQADACTGQGEIGALLRRESLYSSHVTNWRRLRDSGTLAGLTPRKHGRKADPTKEKSRRMATLERENQRLRERLAKAEMIIYIQKKYPACWGFP